MERKSYLPDYWYDDSRMSGLMSMAKARDVNPLDYDRKGKFWTELITMSCYGEKDPVISLEQLKKRFRRGDQIPSCLNVALENMLRSGDIIMLNEFKSRDQSWTEWGYARFVASLWGSSQDASTVEYVHLNTVKRLAEEILQFFQKEYAPDDDISPEIVELNEFRYQCQHLVPSKRAFDLAISQLVHDGQLTIGRSSLGEEILKFKDGSSKGPIEWTESDASVHDMKKAMSKLDSEIKRLEEKAKKAESDARASIRGGDKTRATHFLRVKKRALKEVEDKDNQYQRLLDMMHQIGETKQNKQVIEAYKAGASAFKATLDRQGITADSVDDTMDSMSDAFATAEEIRKAIGVRAFAETTDEDLEAELNSIISEKKKEDALIDRLPAVPVDEPSSGVSLSDESLNRRLQRLRQPASSLS